MYSCILIAVVVVVVVVAAVVVVVVVVAASPLSPTPLLLSAIMSAASSSPASAAQPSAAEQYIAQQQQKLVLSEQQIRALQEENQRLRAVAAQQQAAAAAPQPANPPPVVPRIDLKPMTPSTFHGNPGSHADQWLMEVERYFDIAQVGIEDERRVLLASTYLKGAASVWYMSMARPGMGVNHRWVDFKIAFLERFRPFAASQTARTAIRMLRQHGRVGGYTEEFLRQMALIHDMSEADQISFYVGGLHRDIALEVEREQPATLRAAMDHANRYEILLAKHKGRNFGQKYYPQGHRTQGYSRSNYSQGSSSGPAGDAMDLSAIGMQGRNNYGEDFSYEGEYEEMERVGGRPSEESPNINIDMDKLAGLLLNRMEFGNRSNNNSGRKNNYHHGGNNKGRSTSKQVVPNLSVQEYDRLSREGKCFHCKEPGHVARNCPKLPANRPTKSGN